MVNMREMAVKVLPPAAKRRILRHRHDVWDAMMKYRIRSGRLGPLPSFLIIGFGKCGTTYMYDRLMEHPNIYPSFAKEVDFFTGKYHQGIDWYRAHFASALQHRGDGPAVVGEASVSYVISRQACQRIAKQLPDVKLIVLLRDPADRAYSHFNHMRRLGWERIPSFEDALEMEPTRMGDVVEKILADPTYQPRPAWAAYSYRSQGIYTDYLQWWLEAFPRDQLLILNSEDFYRNPTTTLQNVTDLIELPSWTPGEYAGHKKFSYPKMNPDTRAMLREFYRPHNERLFEMVGEDFGWNR